MLIQGHDFVVVLLCWELANLSLYLLIALGNAGGKERILASTIRYFLLSAFATITFIAGIYLILGGAGGTGWDEIMKLNTVELFKFEENGI